MKKLVTQSFRDKLVTLFPQMFSYTCCAKGTHEKFLQYALFSPVSKSTGAVLFDQETVAKIVGKEALQKNSNSFKSGPYLMHLVNVMNGESMLGNVSDLLDSSSLYYTRKTEDNELNTLEDSDKVSNKKIATLYTDSFGRSFNPGTFATAGELNEFEKIVNNRLVMDANPDRLIRITQGFCRQVNFSFSKEVLDMVDEELNGVLRHKRTEKVYFVNGTNYSYYKNRKEVDAVAETINERIDLLDNEVSAKIARYMNNLPVGIFEEVVNENLRSAMVEIDFIDDEEVKAQQLKILNGIVDQPKVYYQPSKNGNTDRLFGHGCNITGLKKEVRLALTKDWIECDARNLHLAIVGKLWGIDSLQSFLAKGHSFWKYIQTAIGLGDESKKVIKEATYGLVYGMSKKNIISHMNDGLGKGYGEKFVEIDLIQDILESRKHAFNYYLAAKSIEDAYGNTHKVTKENLLTVVSRVCQSYEQKLILSIFELLNKCDGDFDITLYQFDGLSIKFNCNRDHWIKKITEEFNNAALEMGIFTSLSWSLLDNLDRVCVVEATELSEECVESIQNQRIDVSDIQVFQMILMRLWDDLDTFLNTYKVRAKSFYISPFVSD